MSSKRNSTAGYSSIRLEACSEVCGLRALRGEVPAGCAFGEVRLRKLGSKPDAHSAMNQESVRQIEGGDQNAIKDLQRMS